MGHCFPSGSDAWVLGEIVGTMVPRSDALSVRNRRTLPRSDREIDSRTFQTTDTTTPSNFEGSFQSPGPRGDTDSDGGKARVGGKPSNRGRQKATLVQAIPPSGAMNDHQDCPFGLGHTVRVCPVVASASGYATCNRDSRGAERVHADRVNVSAHPHTESREGKWSGPLSPTHSESWRPRGLLSCVTLPVHSQLQTRGRRCRGHGWRFGSQVWR